MSLFIDIIALNEPQSETVLGALYKSIHDHDDGDRPHESPFVRRIIELFYERGIARLEAVKKAITKWESGGYHKPSADVPPRPDGMMARWTPAELELVETFLRALPAGAWTLDDHMMMVDYVIQTYLPQDVMIAEADWMATRSNLMGKVQANMAAPPSLPQADKILAVLPATMAGAVETVRLSPLQQVTLAIGNARAAEHVTNFTTDARRRLRATIMQHAEQQMLAVKGVGGGSSLQTKLLDTFGTLNRDWRRIAITEAGDNQLLGFLASLPAGSRVRRIEQYANACPHCRRIDGKVMTVVPPDHPNKDPETEVWIGKTNVGRSAAPSKRVGNQLVARSPDELWWIPAGLMHPHCRGRWVQMQSDQPGDDPEFGKWLRDLLEQKK